MARDPAGHLSDDRLWWFHRVIDHFVRIPQGYLFNRLVLWPQVWRASIFCCPLRFLYFLFVYPSTLNNYLMWRLAHNYLPYLSREFWEVLDIHKRDTLGTNDMRVFHFTPLPFLYLFFYLSTGAKESVDRWEMCIVTTQKYFGLAMGAIYSKNNVALKDTRNGVSSVENKRGRCPF